jgi:hypothetical protein
MIVGLGASLASLLFVLELVRQRKLREEYSLLWLATAVVLLILSVSRPLLDMLAQTVGIFYPPSALFLVALTFIMFILLHFSTVTAGWRRKTRNRAAASSSALSWNRRERRSSARQTQRVMRTAASKMTRRTAE